MDKNDFNQILRRYASENLSPKSSEQTMASDIYEAVKKTLGNRCFITGSFARLTAITPMHDLDIIYVAGAFTPSEINPIKLLTIIKQSLEKTFLNPTKYAHSFAIQTHSITISFMENKEEKFAIDIVPAFIAEQRNEFGDNLYYVPELINFKRRNRTRIYAELKNTKKQELDWWIISDPSGYIKSSININSKNSDYRKTVKLIKKWKHQCSDWSDKFKLKSFHVEQLVYKIFSSNPNIQISDAIFNFFSNLPQKIVTPCVTDRANKNRFIDDYLNSLNDTEKQILNETRDYLLKYFEYKSSTTPISKLIEAGSYKRNSISEKFLFDYFIQTYIDDSIKFDIDGFLDVHDGFRPFQFPISTTNGLVNINHNILFKIILNNSSANNYKWKVKNDNNSLDPRGEITDNQTKNHPERTQYSGNHFVECYAIKQNICIARSRINIRIP